MSADSIVEQIDCFVNARSQRSIRESSISRTDRYWRSPKTRRTRRASEIQCRFHIFVIDMTFVLTLSSFLVIYEMISSLAHTKSRSLSICPFEVISASDLRRSSVSWIISYSNLDAIRILNKFTHQRIDTGFL